MSIWDSYTLDCSIQFERVQRKFLKFVAFILYVECAPHEYALVLPRFGLFILSNRKKQGNLILFTKFIDSEVDAVPYYPMLI